MLGKSILHNPNYMKILNILTSKNIYKPVHQLSNKVPSRYWYSQIFMFSTSESKTYGKINSNQNLVIARLQQHVNRTRLLQDALIKLSMPIQDDNTKMPQINPQKARMQINKLAPTVALYDQIQALIKNQKDLNDMLEDTPQTQKEQRKFIQTQLSQINIKKDELIDEGIKLLVPPDMYDEYEEVTLQFRAGAGGTQSALFVEDASNMILSYCASMGWNTQIISALKDTQINRGYRIFNIKVIGSEVYKLLKCQSGVHKVIRVPETQNKGRLHSSTISLVVMPAVPFDFSVNQKDIRYQYMRSSGPGGQSVNKTESACRAIHMPTGMSVMIQQDRSQDKNRKRATQILKQRLFEIEYKKNVDAQSQKRKTQIGTMDRSQKIRTYNYPQDRITDHRTGLTKYGIQSMMQGQYLQQFINTYQQKIYNEKLQRLLQQLKSSDKLI